MAIKLIQRQFPLYLGVLEYEGNNDSIVLHANWIELRYSVDISTCH